MWAMKGNSQHQAHFQADHFSTRPGLTSTYLACPNTVYPKSNLADPPVPLGPHSPIPSAIYEGKQAEE